MQTVRVTAYLLVSVNATVRVLPAMRCKLIRHALVSTGVPSLSAIESVMMSVCYLTPNDVSCQLAAAAAAYSCSACSPPSSFMSGQA